MDGKSVKRKKAERAALMVIGGILLVVAAVLLVIFLVRGQTKISGGNPEPIGSTALSCESSIMKYPFFDDDGAVGRNLKVNVILENDSVKSMSLIYRLTYKSDSKAAKEKDLLKVAMNTSVQNGGAGLGSINDTYVVNGPELTMNLYLTGNKLDESTNKYFLLDDIESNKYDMRSLKVALAARSLKCVENN